MGCHTPFQLNLTKSFEDNGANSSSGRLVKVKFDQTPLIRKNPLGSKDMGQSKPVLYLYARYPWGLTKLGKLYQFRSFKVVPYSFLNNNKKKIVWPPMIVNVF